jgi:dTDP-4-dehydrorhamnose 3,5-epimerase
MRFTPAELSGAFLIELDPIGDHRGYFARTFCVREFAEHGLATSFVQHNTSLTKRRGSVRGMHFQRAPSTETKVVSCSRGAIYDVVIDLRPTSPTYMRWQGFKLSAENRRRLYVPDGFAHGFQTLTDDVEVDYLISQFYAPEAASGVRHDDPAFAIRWPLPVADLSDKDKAWSPYTEPLF